MSIHPGGINTTKRLLQMSALQPGCLILDLGAGGGSSVRYLQQLGYQAHGLDRNPGTGVQKGDMTRLPYPDAGFDAVLAECSLSVCGNAAAAIGEARRVLKPGGLLLVSDVYYRKNTGECLSLPYPATKAGWERAMVGFERIAFEDISEAWTQFIIDRIWKGQDLGDCGFYRKAAPRGCGYFLALWKEAKGNEKRRTYHGRRIVLTHGKL